MTDTALYKRVDRDLLSCNGGTHQWVLRVPTPTVSPLRPCENGWHACKVEHLSCWRGAAILRLEVNGAARMDQADKVVVASCTAVELIGVLTEPV